MIFTVTLLKIIFDANSLFTDTDSLTYETKSKDLYEKCFKCKHLFDFSEYQSIFFNPTNKKVLAKRKMNLKEFKSKMYCIVYDDDLEKIAKGVNMSIEFNEYKDVLFNEKVIRHKMERIQSKEHEIGTYDVNKL